LNDRIPYPPHPSFKTVPLSVQKLLPAAETLENYTSDDLWKDGIAGATVALLAIPQCMAYAMIANVDPVYGLYAGIVGALFGSLLGSSHLMITGPTAALCLVVGGVIAGYGVPPEQTGRAVEIAVALALMTGLLQFVFSLLRIGNLARFVSNAVMTGFITGGATVIIGDRILELFNVSGGDSPYFIQRLIHGLSTLGTSNHELAVLPLAIGTGTIVFIFLLNAIDERTPAGLFAVIIGCLLTYGLFGPDHATVETVGELQQVLPSFNLPEIKPSGYLDLFSGALAITILATVQSVSISKSIATKTLDSIDENQELIGQGASNIAAGFVSGFPVCGSLSRTFFNHNAGAQTRFAGLFLSIFMLIAILFASPLIPWIPMAVLHGLVIYVMANVYDWEEIKIALFATRRDQIGFLCTFLSVLLLKLDWAIYAGVAVSLVLYIRKATRLDLKEYVVDASGQLKQITDFRHRIEPSIAFIDVNGETFFGSADQIKERIEKIFHESQDIDVIILRMKNALNLDITGAMVLKEIALLLKERDKTLMICGATPQIRDVLREAEVSDVIGEDKILVAQKNLLASSRQAIDRAKAHIDSVLEGQEAREEEEDPPLKHTMERLDEEIEEKGEELNDSEEDPVEKEKVQPPSDEEVEEVKNASDGDDREENENDEEPARQPDDARSS